MTTWRPAHSLEQLRDEVNARWPARDKASDGMIGDAAHAASASDHNPNAAGVVCAFDITHDPHGPDGSDLSERLRLLPHPDVKYVIWNRRMFSAYPAHGFAPFTWRPYSGADPHTNHVHVSVGVGPDGHSEQPYDDRTPDWLDASPPPVPPTPPPEDLVKGSYYVRSSAKDPKPVFLVLDSANKIPVADFLDVEEVFATELGVHITPYTGSDALNIPDAQGTKRNVHAVDDALADALGLPK